MAARSASRIPVTPAPPTLPPLLRDRWAWLVPLALLPTLWAARGTPLGTPFADDFDFLDFSLLRGNPSWLDGGGGGLYWRPLARQLYYAVLGPLMLEHPGVIAALHALGFVLAGLALYAVLRAVIGRPAAAVAAGTPLMLDGARMVLAWPSCAQELGALAGLSLALLAVARGRWWLAALAAAAALLCKETAAAAVPLLALAPLPALAMRGRRWRALAGAGALLAAWWTVHAWVSARAAQLPIAAVAPPEAAATAWPVKLAWSSWRALRDGCNADLLAATPALAVLGLAGALALIALAALAANVEGRERLRRALPWVAWGLAWFVLTAAPSGQLYPAWASYRALLPTVGLGVAMAALLGAYAGWSLAALVGLRLVALLAAPGAPPRVAEAWSDFGAAFDLPRLARVQRFVAETRRVLQGARPTLPRGAILVKHVWPRMTDYAFEEGKAFRVWYRDTTLRWASFEDLRRDRSLPVEAILQYQPLRTPPMSMLAPDAMRALLAGTDSLRAGATTAGLALLDRAEALEPDTSNAVFLASVQAKRALALLQVGRVPEAETAATRALAHYADDPDARIVLADIAQARGDRAGAVRRLEEQLVRFPGDAQARRRLDGLTGAPPR